MKHLYILLISVLVLSSLGCKEKDTSNITVISTEETQNLLKVDEVQLIDVRTPGEFEEGYIENAQNIDFNSPTFDTDILKLDKEKPVLLYCHSGVRSANSAEKFKLAGFKIIYNFKGGFSTWKHEGLAIKK